MRAHPDLHFTLTTLLPSIILGPLLSNVSTPSDKVSKLASHCRAQIHLQFIKVLAAPCLPNLYLNCIDVRDVAEAHVRAMVEPQAAGQRILLSVSDVDYLPKVLHRLKPELRAMGTRACVVHRWAHVS
jgi:nucleoside-diphosphate-sugar epimerase